jgi:hypothetical protein
VIEHGQQAPGMRSLRELRTLAEVLDMLIEGQVLQAADTLCQRFKAVELASSEGSWAVAQHLELIPPHRSGAVADFEKEAAAQQEMRAVKLRATLDRGRATQQRGGQGAGNQGRAAGQNSG